MITAIRMRRGCVRQRVGMSARVCVRAVCVFAWSARVGMCEFLCAVLTLNVNWDTLIHFFCWPLSLCRSFISTFYLPLSTWTKTHERRRSTQGKGQSHFFSYSLPIRPPLPPTPLPPLLCSLLFIFSIIFL